MRQGWIAAVVCAAALAVAGCSWPPASQVAGSPTTPDRAIVVTRTTTEAKADAAAKSAQEQLAHGAVGVAGVLLGDPLTSAVAYGATVVGLAAIEQGKGVSRQTTTITVPVTGGEPSCSVLKPDGTAYVLVGQATVTALDDVVPDGLPPEDAALWRRMMGALAGGATPQPEGVSPQ